MGNSGAADSLIFFPTMNREERKCSSEILFYDDLMLTGVPA
jgi:hypothetical protein